MVRQAPLIIRAISEAPGLRLRLSDLTRQLNVDRLSIYRVLWRLQMMGAVRAHGRNWSRVSSRWRHGPELLIEQYEALCKATPLTDSYITKGRITDAREANRIE